MIVVAVIIPFYQRVPGILASSVRSVLAQVGVEHIRLKLIVVDDASPTPAKDEFSRIVLPKNIELVLLHRPNGGPGAARNTALDSLDPTEIDFIAFLDSDDRWLPDHLSCALGALAEERDFYFCNHERFDQESSWFDQSDIVREWISTGDAKPVRSKVENGVYSIDRDALLSGMASLYMSQTSTVVYRFRRHAHLRFDTSLRSAGEDHLFWLELAGQVQAGAFCLRPLVECGRGVNVYFSAFDWDTPNGVSRHGYLCLFHRRVEQRVQLPSKADRHNRHEISNHFRLYSFLFFRLLTKGRVPEISVLRSLFVEMPGRVLMMPAYFCVALLSGKARSASRRSIGD